MEEVARLAAGWLLRTAALFALWLALVDNLQTPELATGGVCAGLAAIAATAAHRLRAVEVRIRPALLRRAHRPLILLVTDTFRVAAELARVAAGRPSRGRFRAVRYRATADTPDDAARRSLTEVLGSLGPNRWVAGIDPDREALLVHELAPAGGPLDPMELG